MNVEQFAGYFDSTNLKLEATTEALRVLCEEALAHQFAAVCLYPSDVPLAASILAKSPVRIATVVGFPSGRTTTVAKEADIRKAAEMGVHEVDIVMNYPRLIAGEHACVENELSKLAKAARECDMLSKIIVETCYLNEAQILESLHLCEEAGADFIKTSTGFGSAGACLEHVRLWASKRKHIRIKASGGIRTCTQAMEFIEAGAERLGVSAAAAIMAEFKGEGQPSAQSGDTY